MRELELQLKQVLQSELELYGRILEIARRKTEILKKSKVKELELLTLDERDMVLEAGNLEDRRELVIKKLARTLNLDSKLDLASMSEKFTEVGRAEFIELRARLKAAIAELKQANELNNMLLKDSLDYIDFSLNLMTATTVEGNYGGDFSEPKANTQSTQLFDFKA